MAGLVAGIVLIVILSTSFMPDIKIDDQERQQDVRIRFLSMPGAFATGTAVHPVILIDGTIDGCVAPPHAQILDSATGEVVWDSGISLVLCDPDAGRRTIDIRWEIGFSYMENGERYDNSHAMKADRDGAYELTVMYAGAKEHRTFEVMPAHVALGYPGPQLHPRTEWITQAGSVVDMIQGSGNAAHINAGQDAIFDITLESVSHRGADYWIQVFDADDPALDFLKHARVYPSILSLPDGLSYTLADDIIAVKPMSSATTRLVIHTAQDLPPDTYNIAVQFSTQLSSGELESSSSGTFLLPIVVR